MLLVLSHSGDATANYLCDRFVDAGVPFGRVDTDTCATEVTINYTIGSPHICIRDQVLRPDDISNVWLRRPKTVATVLSNSDTAEQAHVADEWGAALEGFLAHIPAGRWMNHPAHNVRASHKLEQLTRAAASGLGVPATLVTQSRAELDTFWNMHNGRIVAKPLAYGFLERPGGMSSSIYTSRVLAHHLDAAPLALCPTLFQAEIPKACDVRLTAVDGDLTAVALHREGSDAAAPDVRRNNMRGVRYESTEVPTDVAAGVRRLLGSYRLRFAALDFGINTAGEWVFFEVNPNGQWAWLDLVGATRLWEKFVEAFRA